MATTVAELLTRVRHLLQDDGVRWFDDELIRWLNDAQREIVLLKPDAYSTRASYACVAGTLQTLPSGGLQLLDVPRNLDGAKRAIKLTSRYILDAENPTWHSDDESGEIRAYCYDDRAPTAFYVFPPAVEATSIEVFYSASPPVLNAGSNISLSDNYVGALVDYVCYRAYSKDADYAQNSSRSSVHYQAFMGSVAGKQQAETAEGPRTPFNREQPHRGEVR